MTSKPIFAMHPQSKVLDPNSPGVGTLLACIKNKVSIQATQNKHAPISMGAGPNQWLDCETSGSTGKPKVIRRTPESWRASFELAMVLFGIGSTDHYAVLGSLGHSTSLFASLEALHIGATLSVLSGLSPKQQLQALIARTVTVIYATPTQLKQLCALAAREQIGEISHVRRVLVGGGKLYRKERLAISRLFPAADVVEFYGTSETSFITLGGETAPPGSVGCPYLGVELAISGTGTPFECGEVRVKSPYLAECYVGTETTEIKEQDGFVSTGEVGYLDEDGFLYIKGRSDRMITVSDVNVFLEAIEQAIASFDSVDACSVIAIPDTQRGNRTICFVEQSGAHFSPSVLRRHCRETLGEHHVPKEIRRIDVIPMTPSGKPDLQTLAQLAVASQ